MTEMTMDTPTNDTSSETVESVTPDFSTNDVVSEPEFTPNYKYKAYGKEYEITDEWAKPLFNKDNQEHFTKLYEKAGGFDHLKEHSKRIESEYQTTKQNFDHVLGVKQKLLQNLERGDLDSVFGYLGLNQEKIFDYARQKLEYQNLPPEQKQAFDQYNRLNQQNFQYEEQLQTQRQMMEDIARQKHELETMQVFGNPKYSNIISSYNSNRGSETAFNDVVRMVGSNEFYTTGRNIPVQEAVDRAINFLGLSAQDQAQVMSTQTNNIQNNRQAPKPIAQIGKGGSQVPVKKNITTMADLLREREQAFAEY